MSKPLFVFDLDHTLVNGDTSTMWCEYMVENDLVQDKEAFLARERELMDQYAAGVMKVEDYIAFSTEPLSNRSCEEVDEIIGNYVKSHVSNCLFAEGLDVISRLKNAGERILVISASADLIVRQVTKLFGIPDEDVIAVNVKRVDNKYVGEIEGIPSYKDGKVDCLRRWQLLNPGYEGEVTFYTDSINDLPLCLVADNVFAINPGKLFLEEATKRGYTILEWNKAVA